MIRHILKIIWSERKINSWILFELVLVFSIVWFCVDYASNITKRYLEPVGFDIKHTYRINIGIKDQSKVNLDSEDSVDQAALVEDIWTIYDKIKLHPAIEQISYSQCASPYTGMHSGGTYTFDSIQQEANEKWVTPEFFEVFGINFTSGQNFEWNAVSPVELIILGGGPNDRFIEKPVEEVKNLTKGSTELRIIGTVNKTKRNDYENYLAILYHQIKRGDPFLPPFAELSVRVKSESDKNFAETFSKDMRRQLNVGNYYLASVVPISKQREDMMKWFGYTDNFKNISAVATFLFINIFLGVIGTFWFRVQSRRSELGVRLAVGASKYNVRFMLAMEGVLLLLFASVIATILCVNLAITDILKSINVPITEYADNSIPLTQYFINYSVTFILLGIITVFAVWYPAWRASAVQPAETLKDE